MVLFFSHDKRKVGFVDFDYIVRKSKRNPFVMRL